jgi:hypothetical protein
MYVFLFCMLFINVFLISKVFVYLLEVFLNYVIIPLMNWTNNLHRNMYRLELRKVMIEDEHNNAFLEHYDEHDDEHDDESEDILDNISDVLSETSDESNEKIGNGNFIDEKLD